MDDTHSVLLDLPATHQYLNVLSACLAAVLERLDGLDHTPEGVYGIQLAVHEVCANIVEHAYGDATGGRIQALIRLDPASCELVVELRDTAMRAFDWAIVPEPDLDGPQARGYGLFLARSLMDEVICHACPGDNHWWLRKRLAARPPQSP